MILVPGSAECSHFYGKLAVTFKIGVGVEEEIAYTLRLFSLPPILPWISFHSNENKLTNNNESLNYIRNGKLHHSAFPLQTEIIIFIHD